MGGEEGRWRSGGTVGKVLGKGRGLDNSPLLHLSREEPRVHLLAGHYCWSVLITSRWWLSLLEASVALCSFPSESIFVSARGFYLLTVVFSINRLCLCDDANIHSG